MNTLALGWRERESRGVCCHASNTNSVSSDRQAGRAEDAAVDDAVVDDAVVDDTEADTGADVVDDDDA